MFKLTFFQKGGLLLLCLFLQISMTSAGVSMLAPVVSVSEEGSAPEINLAFSYGTENDPVSATSSLTMVYAYTGYSIDEAESDITVDLAGSWFGNASQVSVSYSINHEAREVSVTLTRNDNQQIGGFGFNVRLKGIIVIVDDIMRIMSNTITDFQVDTYYASDTQTLLMMMGKDYGQLKFTLYNLNGQVIAQKNHYEGNKGKWHMNSIAPQVYILEMTDGERILRKKVFLGQ